MTSTFTPLRADITEPTYAFDASIAAATDFAAFHYWLAESFTAEIAAEPPTFTFDTFLR
jgi:hypothetical protein